jgi:hypothetical protein
VLAAASEMSPEVCDVNLGPVGRRKRLRLGVAAGFATVALIVALLVTDAQVLARLAIAPFAFVAASGFLQYRAKT